MTDQLEELLEQLEPEDGEASPLDWLETLGPVWVPRRENGGDEAGSEGAPGGQTLGADWAGAEKAGEAASSQQSRTGDEMPPEKAEETGTERLGPAAENETGLRYRREGGWSAAEGAAAGSWNEASAALERRNRAEPEGADAALEAQESWKSGLTGQRGQGQDAQALYRQLVWAQQWAAPPARRTDRAAVTQQVATGAPSLTADQLDRAVRRDSRRYDGGMELY